ncbi:MAG: orotate phosphoribosyltransferase [bacterium]
MDMNDLLRMIAADLFKIGAIKFGAFKLKLHEKHPDAPLSPIYIDLRVLRSHPTSLNMVVSALIEASADIDYDLIADIPISVSPIVAVFSHKSGIPMITPRLTVKERGTRASVLGDFEAGQTVLLIDDLITKADSKLEAIQILEEKGLVIKDVLVLIDREQGGKDQLAEREYSLHSVFTLPQLMKHYLDTEKIDQTRYDEVITYLAKN